MNCGFYYASAYKRMQMDTNVCIYDTETDTVNDTDTVTDTDNDTEQRCCRKKEKRKNKNLLTSFKNPNRIEV